MSIKFGDFASDIASDELFARRLRAPAPAVERPAEFIGTLKHWNADRFFGFITRDDQQADMFVHGKAFELAGIDPEVGQRLAFTVGMDRIDRPRVERLRRAAGSDADARGSG